MKFSVLNRKLHRWGAILSALPVLVIIATGLLLQLKKDVAWIQPPTQRGSKGNPTLSFDRILEVARSVPEAAFEGWEDIDRLDVRPERGVVKVRGTNRWEVQIDTDTGEILQVAYRRSDLIENIHDGSFFHDGAKLWVFLTSGIVLLGLWISGIYLFVLPYTVRWRRKKK
jgi:uncharacterized iron-regulated membrane protein